MAGGNIRAGGAFVEIFGKDMLDKSLKAAGANFQAFGKTVTAVGAGIAASGTAALAPLLAMTKTFASVGDDAQKAALRTGATTNAISELGYAAQQSGSSLSDVEVGIKNMQRQITAASEGGEAAAEAFARLGLTVKDLQDLTPDRQFELIADRMAAISDPAIRAATAMELFGRSGVNLLPLMESGAAGIRALREEAIELGASIDQADADAAAALGDAWDRAVTSFKGAAIQVGAALAPALEQMSDTVTRLVVITREWLTENRQTVVAVAAVAAGAIAAGTAIAALGTAITAVGVALSSAVALVGTLSTVFLGILNPVNLIIAALAAAGGAMVAFSLRGVDAIGTLGDTMQGVLDALASGEIEKAWEIVVLGLEVIFARWTERILTIWDAFIDDLREKASRLDPFAITLTKSPDAAPPRNKAAERAAVTQAAEERLAIALMVAAADRELAIIERETDRFLAEQERKRAMDAAIASAAPVATDMDSGDFAGPAGLLGSAIASAIEMGLAAVDTAVNRIESTGTFSGQAAGLLGATTSIEKEQLDKLDKIREATERVVRATERNAAVFI